MVNKYRCKSCGNEGIYADGARHCPLCGGDLVKIEDGSKALRRSLRHAGYFVEGVLAMAVIMAVGAADIYDGTSLMRVAVLIAMMTAVYPITRIGRAKKDAIRRKGEVKYEQYKRNAPR